MKKALLAALSAIATATVSFADTITWTGGGDGVSWGDNDNWSSGASPLNNFAYDVVVDGDSGVFKDEGKTVTYTSGDLTFTGTLTIKNGARFYQNADSWPNFANGTLIVSNAVFDLSHSTGATTIGTLEFYENGTIVGMNCASAKSILVHDGGLLTVSSNIDSSKLTLEPGASFIATDGDLQVFTDTTFGAVNLTAYTITTPETDGVRAKISLQGTKLTTTRSGAICGIWDARYAGEVNFLSGADSTFTFPSSVDGNTVHDKASAYNYLFKTGYFYFNGEPVLETSDVWVDHFEVTSEDGMTTVAYTDILSENRIASVSAESVTSTSATLSAVIASQDEGTIVKLAYGLSEQTESEVLEGETVVVESGVASKVISGLSDFSQYYYAFAIVDPNGANVLDMKRGMFVASDFEYIYNNGSWVGGESPNWASTARVLVLGSFTTGEINPENKMFKNATVQLATIANGNKPLTVSNSSVINIRLNNLVSQVPYGIWAIHNAINFTTASGNGVFYGADSYTCYVTQSQYENAYDNFIANGRLTVDGSTITSSLAESNLTLTSEDTEQSIIDGDVEYPVKKMTVTLWDSFPADASGEWIAKAGARVKLSGNVKLASLTIEAGAVIDLNGHTLKTSALTVDGVTMKGEYTSATLECLVGEGSLAVAGNGLVIVIR